MIEDYDSNLLFLLGDSFKIHCLVTVISSLFI